MKANRVIYFSEGNRFDLSDVGVRQRIVLSMKEKKFVLKSGVEAAKNEQKRFASDAIILSSTQCCTIFPLIFYKGGQSDNFTQRVLVLLSDAQKDFLKSKGNVNAYVRSLIDKAMKEA